jgi:hypothetical protein
MRHRTGPGFGLTVMAQTLTQCSQNNISFPLSQLQYAKDANMGALNQRPLLWFKSAITT